MNELTLYKNTISIKHTDVIVEFKKVPYGQPLPRENACTLFYDFLSYPGETIVLKTGKQYHFFLIEHDDIIQELDTEHYNWIVEKKDASIYLTLLLGKEMPSHINFYLNMSNDESKKIYRFILSRKKIEVHFLNLLYGGIVKEMSAIFKIPREIIRIMK